MLQLEKYNNALPLSLLCFLEIVQDSLRFDDEPERLEKWRARVKVLPREMRRILSALLHVAFYLKDNRSCYTLDYKLELLHDLVTGWVRYFTYIYNYERDELGLEHSLLGSFLIRYDEIIYLDRAVSKVPTILEVDSDILKIIINKVTNFVVLNNLFILSALFNRQDILDHCLAHGADDVVTAKKAATISHHLEIIDHLETVTVNSEKYLNDEIYNFYHKVMDHSVHFNQWDTFVAFTRLDHTWTDPREALREPYVFLDAPMALWGDHNMFTNMTLITFPTLLSISNVKHYNCLRAICPRPLFTPTPENSDASDTSEDVDDDDDDDEQV